MSRDRPDPAQTALALDPPEDVALASPPKPRSASQAASAAGPTTPTAGPSDATVRRLFAVSANRCAFPGCSRRIIDPATRAIQAEVCHIHGRDERQPRYDPRQPAAERHGFDNLLLMCAEHHKFIDAKEALSRFTPAALQQLKAAHEKEARRRAVLRVRLTDDQLANLQGVAREGGGAAQDFRQAVSRSMRNGGQRAITLLGTTRVPASVLAEAQAGAAVDHCGRPADSDDLARGLRVGAMFLANSVGFNNALLDVAGAGWTFLPLGSVMPLRLPLALIVDFGDVEPWTLLRFTVRVVAPSGAAAQESVLDLEVPDNPDLIKRISVAHPVDFLPTEFGAWTVTLGSAAHELGSHRFECRQASA